MSSESMSLFGENHIHQPLADAMRPQKLDEIVGQHELLDAGQPLRQIIDKGIAISLILWGPPGTGKSTLAYVMAKTLKLPFEKFNASTENKAVLQKFVSKYPNESFVLQLDEIHRLTKPIQDFLLPYLESGQILLVGTTTENPVITINPAIRSRCQLFEFKPVTANDVVPVLQRTSQKIYQFDLAEDLALMIGNSANGDVRVALNILETLVAMHGKELSHEQIAEFAKNQHFVFDKDSTNHYDYLSAFQDSVGGSDTDAALYYLSVILNSGDLESAVRRIRDLAYMFIGLADSHAVDTAMIACQTALQVGLPRASTHLAYATITLCLAPKSDSAVMSYNLANEDGKESNQLHRMPSYLRDAHYKHSVETTGGGDMLNPFDQPHQIAKQQYLPDNLIDRHYYKPRENKREQALNQRYQALRQYIYAPQSKQDNKDNHE
ncbi:ATPase, AAA family [Pediococcus damnosus]|uniref:replication-associated recombination protein A n=2 Tax=Pediococcus damnosus TaxID=51663 RepID=UPI00078CCC54|nr:replication-associated recombination protein A [Pediococcus damnosus]AMV68464.1 ATPase, AAA family [Pediococcus damnosus]